MLAPLTDNSREDRRIWAFLCPVPCRRLEGGAGDGALLLRFSSSRFLCKKKLSSNKAVFTRLGFCYSKVPVPDANNFELASSEARYTFSEGWGCNCYVSFWVGWDVVYCSSNVFLVAEIASALRRFPLRPSGLGELKSCCWNATRLALTTLGMSNLLAILSERKRFWLRSRTNDDDAEGALCLCCSPTTAQTASTTS